MSAPAKEPQPLGSTSGKRGYIRVCVRCGVTMYGVGRRAMYCPECRRIVANEKSRQRERLKRERARRPPTGPDVREVAAQVDAAGMTYGQYVARGCLTNRPKETAKAHPRDDAWPRFCQRCGVEIADPKRGQKYCDECRPIVKAMQTAESARRRRKAVGASSAIQCQRCGKPIEHPRGPQKYCLDCRIAMDKERAASPDAIQSYKEERK